MYSQNYIQNRHLAKALVTWLNALNFTHFLTLTFNTSDYHKPQDTLQFARNQLRDFHKRLDRRLLGSRWYKKSKEQRTFFIAFPEKIATNMHYHLLVRINDVNEKKFNECAEKIWKTVVPSGTFDCKILRHAPDAKGYASYVTKEQHKVMNFNHTIVSTEFLNI